MANAQKMLADDVQPGLGQKMVDIGDAAHQRIFHRNDAEIRIALAHRFGRVLECRTRHRDRVRQNFARREMGVGAGLALKSDALGVFDGRTTHVDFPKTARAFSRSAAVSTLSGTLSTRATSIVMPASRARN